MNKYAQVALIAAEYINTGFSPENAWQKASCEVFDPDSPAQKKGCPKNAFLGLYGVNTQSRNAVYARKALDYLKVNGDRLDERALWNIVLDGQVKSYNNQMHVVLALFRKGLV